MGGWKGEGEREGGEEGAEMERRKGKIECDTRKCKHVCKKTGTERNGRSGGKAILKWRDGKER